MVVKLLLKCGFEFIMLNVKNLEKRADLQARSHFLIFFITFNGFKFAQFI